jgi:hypothetical protein
MINADVVRQSVKLLHLEYRQRLRAHPSQDELKAYYEGRLSSQESEVLVDHLAVCESCSTLLIFEIADANGNSRGKDSQIKPDVELKEVWNRLQPEIEKLKGRSPRGRPLTSLLATAPFPLEKALPLALEISRALAQLHAAGHVHHDLRPENILLDDGGRCRLLDMGPIPNPASFEIGYGRTADEAMLELYSTLSPEQALGERLDRRSNLFSLGVVLYQLLTGVSPFRDSTPLATISNIVSLEPAPANELNPAVPPALSALLERLLAKRSADRPPSASMVVRDLESLCKTSACQGGRPAAAEPVGQGSIEEQIDVLYDEIIALTETGQAGEEKHREQEIERAYARLRELQEAEAREFRERFEASLEVPIDAGDQILGRARALRKELEDLATSNPAASQGDGPPPSAETS